MYTLIGDMYREREVLSLVIDPALPVLGTGPSGTDGEISSVLNAIWVNFPASYTARDHGFTRVTDERTLKLDAMIFDRLTAPQDSEPMPEQLSFHLQNASIVTIQNVEQLFIENFGDLFSVRSNIHERLFLGVIPSWEIEHGGTCRTSFSFDMIVKETHPISAGEDITV